MAEYLEIRFADTDELVSEEPTLANAVRFTLRADLDAVGEWIRVYAIPEDGYEVTECIVTPTGDNLLMWQLAPDDGGEVGTPVAYGAPLSLGTVDDGVPTYFWIRAKAVNTETPVNDATVTLPVSGVAAVPEE